MDEKYVNIIYNILSNDKNFAKNSPIGEFVNKIKDEKYAKNVYDIISNWDPNFAENTNYDPKSPYSASKAAADHAVRSYANTYGLNYVITNCSNNYGPYQYPEKLIPIIINSLNNKSEIPIYGDGKNIRDWIHVQDHVDAIYKCMVNGKTNNTYLIGANNEISNLNLTLKISKIYKNLFQDDFNYFNNIKFV